MAVGHLRIMIRAHLVRALAPALTVSVLSVAACDAEVAPPTAAAERAPIGKADLVDGSCAAADGDYCGGPSDGLCYCDVDCTAFGDCCADVVAVCETELVPEVLFDGLDAPESIVFDPGSQTYFVTNLAHNILETDPLNPPEGNVGFVSQHRVDGSVIKERWAEGFASPKGIEVANGIVYIADPKAVVAIDIQSAKEVARYTSDEIGLFNDVAVADDGMLYATDTANPSLYRIDPSPYADEPLARIAKDDRFEFPNGVTVDGKVAFVATTGLLPSEAGPGTPGRLFKVSLKSGEVEEIEGIHGKWDGVVVLEPGVLAVNDFMTGEVHRVDLSTGKSEKLLDSVIEFETPPAGLADMNIAGSTLLIPSMFTNEIWAYAPEIGGKSGS